MPTNALLKTNVSGTWSSSTGLSYSQIPTISGISHKDQLEVERVFSTPFGTALTQEDFRKIYVVPAANYTVDETGKKITAFSASLPSYTTVGGTIVSVPAITNGAVIAIRRKSITSESLVNWVDGTRLTASQLNLQTSQLISVVQEILDRMNYEFVTATDLDYNFSYKWATRSWVYSNIEAVQTSILQQLAITNDMNTTQNGRLDAIESLNTSQTSSINTLNTRVSPSTSLTGTYSASNLSAAVNGLDTRTTSVESRVTSVESTNTTQTNNISALQTKVGAGTVTGTIVANGSDIITAVNAIDDYVTNAVTTGTNTIFNGHAQGRIVYAGANGTKDSTANFTITPSGTSPTVLTLAGNLSQTGNLTQTGVLTLTGNTTSVLSLTGTFTVNADSATVPTFKGASAQKIIAFKNSSNTEVNAIDQYGNLTGRATAIYGSSSPTNPIAGSIWYDSVNTAFKIYNGSAWTQISTTTLANYVGLSGNETVAGNKTFSGDMTLSSNLTVDTNTLFVDATNNRVGIGLTNPAVKLHVSGSSATTEQIYIVNSSSTSYATTSIAGSAGVSGAGVPANSVWFEGVPASSGNTYLSSYNNNLAFATGTSRLERMRIDSSGNVGIGTASPGYKLSLSSTAGLQGWATDGTVQQAFAYPSNTAAWSGTLSNHAYVLMTNNTEQMRIDSSGKVGIGTGSPQHKLVVSNAGSEGLEVVPGNTAGSTILQAYNRSDSTYDTMDLRASDFKIRIEGTEKVTIDSSGNVGIGITNPTTKLHVSGASATTESIYLANSSSTSFVQTIAAGSTGVPAAGVPANSVWIEGAPASSGNTYLGSYYNNLAFATGRVERMRIDTSGNLIIGNINAAGNTSRALDIYNHATGASAASLIRLITHDASGTPAPSSIGQIIKYQTGGFAIHNTDTNAAAHIRFDVGNSERMRINSSGNIGINTNSPINGLHIYNKPLITQTASTNTIHYRDLANYVYSGGAAGERTGIVEISLPTTNWQNASSANMNTMLNITIDGANYNPSASWQVKISAYHYANGTQWHSSGVQITGKCPFNTVRLGYNTTTNKPVILLGETTTVWSYPRINLSSIYIGYASTTDVIWSSGWAFTDAITSTSNYTLNYNGSTPIANFVTNTSNQNSFNTANTFNAATTFNDNVTIGSAKKLISPTVETDLIISTNPIRFIANSDRYAVITSSTSDLIINNDGVAVFSQPPKYSDRGLLYVENGASADVASATSGFRFGTGFTNYNSSNYPVRYTKIGPLIILQGLISAASTNTALGSTVALLKGLPAPAQTTIHTVQGIVNIGGATNNYKTTLRGDITAGGEFVVSYEVGDGQNNVTTVPSLNTSTTNWIALSIVYLADFV